MQELSSVRDIIEKLGGNPAVKDLTGLSYKNVYSWTYRGVFASNTYCKLMKALKKRGYTAPSRLWQMIE